MADLPWVPEEAEQNADGSIDYSRTVLVQGGPEPVYNVETVTAEGGDRAWRTNNPANLHVKGDGSDYNNQIGSHTAEGSELAVFTSINSGKTAAYNNIFDNDHSNMTVEDRVKAWPGFEDIPGGLTKEQQEDNYWDAAKNEIPSSLWNVLMSTINGASPTAQSADKTDVYNGILRAENGWEDGTPSGGDIGTVSSPPEVAVTPLVLDLNGDGVQTLSIDEGVKFDFDGDGQKEDVGWAHEEDGFLALDLNGDGKIRTGEELFGSETLVEGEAAGDGYIALRQYDTNSDNLISAEDDVFSQLLVWIDSNSNGVSNPQELHSLADLGISSISLDNYFDFYAQNGNYLVKHGVFTYDNGDTNQLTDVHFDTENQANLSAGTEGQEIGLMGISPDNGMVG